MPGGNPTVPAQAGGEAYQGVLVYGGSFVYGWALNTAMYRFQPNTWVEVGKEGVNAKVKALSMYRGVMRPYPHPRSAEAIEGFAAYRGCQAGCNYAEAFEVALRRL